MASLLIGTAFNLFVGDAGPDNSKHLKIRDLKVPDMTEMSAAHHSGGSLGGIQIANLGHDVLAASFTTTGWDVQTLSQFGVSTRAPFPFTAYGNLQDKDTGKNQQMVITMFGRLTRVGFPSMSRGGLQEFTHDIGEITLYQLVIGGQEIFYWNWKTSAWRVMGKAANQDEITNLAIPTL